MRLRSRIAAALLYALYLGAALAAVVWVAHWRWAAALARRRGPAPAHAVPQIDARTMGRLGWLHAPDERASSFANAPDAKPPGTIRIGCYGDSFTWGAEVADGLDYPALLRRALRARGRDDIEVLNFGVPGYGLHQSAMLHRATATRWGIDRAVLLAMPFWPERDTTFMAPWSDDRLHARYVLRAGGGVRRVDVAGETYEERLDRYNALLAPERYWRYDRRPPPLLRAVLPAGRTIANPWYYRDDDAGDEARLTYRALLPRLAPVLVLEPRPSLFPDEAATVELPDGFPYRTSARHLSPWGNRRLAAQVADLLLGADAAPEPRLAVTALEAGRHAAGTVPPHAWTDLTVTLDDLPAGGVVAAGGGGLEPEEVTALPAPVGALVGLAPDVATPLTDAVFVPVAAGASGIATAAAGGSSRRLSDPRPAGATLALRRLDVCGDGVVHRLLGAPPTLPCRIETPRGTPWSPDLVVALDGAPVLAGSVGGDAIVLRPTGRRYLIRARGDVEPAFDRLPSSGRVWLRGRDASGIPQREPLATWRVER